jgi:hypothetical protein
MTYFLNFFIIICICNCCTLAQNTLCNDSLIMSIKGTWSKYPQQPMMSPVTKSDFDQATKNMEAFHQLLLEAYPQGTGCEPQVNMINPHPAFYTPWVYSYNYYTAVFYYFCNKNKLFKTTETHTSFRVIVNNFERFWTSTQFFIHGNEIFSRQPRAGKWKEYEAYFSEEQPLVMLTRMNMLPYKPVTRKQYLDYMIAYFDSLYTAMADQFNKSDDPYMKEKAASITDGKNDILKIYREEIVKSGNRNLLDSPAVVKGIGNVSFSENTDIFISEERGGTALLMINADYFKKDLPKTVPQFIIVRIQGGVGSPPETYFSIMMKEKFPFEKLEAMIR